MYLEALGLKSMLPMFKRKNTVANNGNIIVSPPLGSH